MDSSTAEVYRRFADFEAAGVSQTYFEWASEVAADADVLKRIEELPTPKRQPNLVFGSARSLGAPTGSYPRFREWLLAHWSETAERAIARSTQTNEAGRCAVLLPVLARLDGPLALIEAGASAGLALYPDRYSYRYERGVGGEMIEIDPESGPSPVRLPCVLEAGEAPARLPEVVWRAGVDLNPIDVRDADSMAWLEALVWPEHDERRARLRLAAEIAAADPPLQVRGDILERIPELVAEAPGGAHFVVFHSAVLAYLEHRRREEFAELMLSMSGVTWVSNEGPRVMPGIAAKASAPPPDALGGRMLLAVNGEPVAYTGPHGQSYAAL